MAAQESFTPQLTPEQWAGLARLGDLAHGSASFMESPAGNLPMDLALKAANVQLVKHFPPPSETNFSGGWLAGSQAACQAACDAFREAVCSIAEQPIRM